MQGRVWVMVCGTILTLCPMSRVKQKNHPESLRMVVPFSPPLHHWHTESTETGGEEEMDRENCFLGVIIAREGPERDNPGPHISFATSDFQIKWAQSADQNEIFLIDFPESLAGSANRVMSALHHHQPLPAAGMSERGRCWQICHWCMRPGKIQLLLAWQCWPGLSINEEQMQFAKHTELIRVTTGWGWSHLLRAGMLGEEAKQISSSKSDSVSSSLPCVPPVSESPEKFVQSHVSGPNSRPATAECPGVGWGRAWGSLTLHKCPGRLLCKFKTSLRK